ncbi:Uncharacterised protein [Mycobacterium tuberculosis]|uniref:Uncharacterized protein n=1 Tax=Mycobacterium tuberculosis TaxID=1773 RepID=A0A0U0TXM6_MYCTX|nr:Uncharacterised protein [Mycobacterium tuberculosis]CFE77840.1 Uncharacterised protein [Mycobacterium tuberculosis]CKS13650.1 Uncharacterised protein [Mycobacterium tuberculosis]CKT69963.1 Uncharacterised protein [Mycobacterium tuberculosis]CNM99023.1 Uncharacterised protein [Mycobacterium tuberculosis]
MCRQPVALGDLGRSEQGGLGKAAAQVEHPDRDRIVGDHLQQVAVSADHDYRVAALPGCQRAQHVVGFESRGACHRDPERVQ